MPGGGNGAKVESIPFASFPQSHSLPCPECGAPLERAAAAVHVCESERVLDYRISRIRHEIAQFDAQLAGWLDSPQGRFAVWLAERERTR
jgi:hypothetical protein